MRASLCACCYHIRTIKAEPNLNSGEYIITFGQMFVTFVITFICCNIGEMTSNQFDLFDEQLYQCNWYLLSNEMQRMLIIFMPITQQPSIIRGFGNVEVRQETFKMVNSLVILNRKFVI